MCPPMWFDSCKRPPPVSDPSVFAFWVVAHGRFDCVCFTRLQCWSLIDCCCNVGQFPFKASRESNFFKPRDRLFHRTAPLQPKLHLTCNSLYVGWESLVWSWNLIDYTEKSTNSWGKVYTVYTVQVYTTEPFAINLCLV